MMHTLWQNISSKHSARLFSTCSLSRTILNQTWDKREPNIYRGRNFNYNFTYIHKYIYRYILWWYCSWFAIGLAYRQPIVENSLKISLKISWQFLWQSILPHLLPQKMIVNISLKFRQRFRCFNSSLTKFQRSFGRNFGDFFCGKMFCHKENFRQNARGNEILPCGKTFGHNFCHKKKSSKFRQWFLCFNSSSDGILTKFWRKKMWQNLVAKRFATKHPTKSLTKFRRN